MIIIRGGNLVSLLVLTLLGIAAWGSHATTTGRRRQGDAVVEFILDARKWEKKPENEDEALATVFNNKSRVVHYSQDGLKEKDRIAKLPGQPGGVDFAQFGGYVTVDEKAGRALFYYFVEAVGRDPSSKPLLLWLNGGPGCSSLGFGALEELGPFRVRSDGRTLFRNPYSWNRVANVVFLESPAGVGYSYSNTTSDYYRLSGDTRTAEDAHMFLVNWLERFPEYKGRDFYISGESYAGHFVTQLAHTIHHSNQLFLPNSSVVNLKGILIGNAVINDETDYRGMFDYFWTHALISEEAINGIHRYCDFTLFDFGGAKSRRCQRALDEAYNVFGDALDAYNIYAPSCASTSPTALPKRTSIENFDPCTDYYVEAYLNLPEVQEALHANVTKLNYTWTACSEKFSIWKDRATTVLPLLREFIANGIRVWVYSGDIDGVVPVTSTRYSVAALKLPVKIPWHAWNVRGEVGGYSVVYKGGLTLATVRGAGHEAPSYQPLRSLVLVKYFLRGKPLPTRKI